MFRNVNLSNMENVLQGNLRTETGSAFLAHLGAQILKNIPLGASHGEFVFVGWIYVQVCPKKTLDTSL